jgi:predicted TIM-barrel fold metal-dependent hydrolase
MIIDCHAHMSAPQQLWAYRSLLLAHRGWNGPSKVAMTDDEIRQSLDAPEIAPNGHMRCLHDHGTDVQLLSPRPWHLMHSESPQKLIGWFAEECHNALARQTQLWPGRFFGIASLPQCAGQPITLGLPELERCIKELGFVGAMISPDPYENGGGGEAPPMGDRYWYPLYEKLCELDIPALVHATTSKSPRVSYSEHMINEETIAVLGLLNSDVFTDFPTLKLIIPHGGGSIPYQLGRFDAASLARGTHGRFRDRLKLLYYDTVLYTPEAIEFLIKTVGADRCVFGSECPGTGSVFDPEQGRQMDDLKHHIDRFDWLSTTDRQTIYEGNARRLFKLDGRLPASA